MVLVGVREEAYVVRRDHLCTDARPHDGVEPRVDGGVTHGSSAGGLLQGAGGLRIEGHHRSVAAADLPDQLREHVQVGRVEVDQAQVAEGVHQHVVGGPQVGDLLPIWRQLLYLADPRSKALRQLLVDELGHSLGLGMLHNRLQGDGRVTLPKVHDFSLQELLQPVRGDLHQASRPPGRRRGPGRTQRRPPGREAGSSALRRVVRPPLPRHRSPD
mmetsp:Transcript_42782/g.127866  ORF Transcript_42782/g.127866 Transcript_42782/m.127866 type:complete len:215 (+) Transcript_42782:634-1278(+)